MYSSSENSIPTIVSQWPFFYGILAFCISFIWIHFTILQLSHFQSLNPIHHLTALPYILRVNVNLLSIVRFCIGAKSLFRMVFINAKHNIKLIMVISWDMLKKIVLWCYQICGAQVASLQRGISFRMGTVCSSKILHGRRTINFGLVLMGIEHTSLDKDRLW